MKKLLFFKSYHLFIFVLLSFLALLLLGNEYAQAGGSKKDSLKTIGRVDCGYSDEEVSIKVEKEVGVQKLILNKFEMEMNKQVSVKKVTYEWDKLGENSVDQEKSEDFEMQSYSVPVKVNYKIEGSAMNWNERFVLDCTAEVSLKASLNDFVEFIESSPEKDCIVANNVGNKNMVVRNNHPFLAVSYRLQRIYVGKPQGGFVDVNDLAGGESRFIGCKKGAESSRTQKWILKKIK